MADNVSDIVAVNITGTSPGLTQASFNTSMFVCAHTHSMSKRVLTYTSPADMVADGWAVTETGYLMAQAQASQNPAPALFKIGRRAIPYTQSSKLTVTDATGGARYAFTVGGTAVSYTVPTTTTTTAVATALVTAAGAVTGYTIAASTSDVTFTRTATNLPCNVSGWTKNLTYLDTTADPGLATDLAAIQAEDDDWYGLDIDNADKAEILAAAAWAEANGKLFTPRSSDSAVKDSASSTDVASALLALAYKRTGLMFSGSGSQNFSGAAWQGAVFPSDPGTENWAFKPLTGIPSDSLTASERLAVENKKGSVYSTRKGAPITQFGLTPSGQFLDFTRGLDWLKEDMQTRVFALFLANDKVPFTDTGVAMIRSCVAAALEDAVGRGFITPGYTITVKKISDLSPTAKASRLLPSGAIVWSATSAGAINGVTINGTVG